MARPARFPQNVAYADEVAACLQEMEVGDTRILMTFPSTMSLSNLTGMLERRGWYKPMHYLLKRATTPDPTTSRPYYIRKTRESIAANKFAKDRERLLDQLYKPQ